MHSGKSFFVLNMFNPLFGGYSGTAEQFVFVLILLSMAGGQRPR
jgi:hypothetical protein